MHRPGDVNTQYNYNRAESFTLAVLVLGSTSFPANFQDQKLLVFLYACIESHRDQQVLSGMDTCIWDQKYKWLLKKRSFVIIGRHTFLLWCWSLHRILGMLPKLSLYPWEWSLLWEWRAQRWVPWTVSRCDGKEEQCKYSDQTRRRRNARCLSDLFQRRLHNIPWYQYCRSCLDGILEW